MLGNHKITFRKGIFLIGSSGEFSTPKSVPAVLEGGPISALIFRRRANIDSSFLAMPKIFLSAWLEEFFGFH